MKSVLQKLRSHLGKRELDVLCESPFSNCASTLCIASRHSTITVEVIHFG